MQFALASRDDKDALNAVDALIFSIAAVELKIFNGDNREHIESERVIFSANFRTIFS